MAKKVAGDGTPAQTCQGTSGGPREPPAPPPAHDEKRGQEDKGLSRSDTLIKRWAENMKNKRIRGPAGAKKAAQEVGTSTQTGGTDQRRGDGQATVARAIVSA